MLFWPLAISDQDFHEDEVLSGLAVSWAMSIPNVSPALRNSIVLNTCILKPSLLCCLDVLYLQDATVTNTLLFPLYKKVRYKVSVVFLSTPNQVCFLTLKMIVGGVIHYRGKKKKKYFIFGSSLNFIVLSFGVIFLSTRRGSNSSVSRTKCSIWYMFHM